MTSLAEPPSHRDRFGWPTTIDPDTGGELLEVGTTVDALSMRAGFGGEVNSYLKRHLQRASIIVVPGDPTRWVFLTGPRIELRLPVLYDLMRIEVGWYRRGHQVRLPTSDTAGARWLTPPQAELPPFAAVVAAARSVSSLCATY